ncbi:MAG TPA: Spy/CpxP family protein refolding chaperone [Caulobacteraceae bacterium]|jgi:hypothetical protein|nr:Spy/CpxP family protein refolding chaperone [Caulobacteraceae bacterium]
MQRFRPSFAPFAVAAALLMLAGAAHAQRSPDLQDIHDALHLSPTQEGAWQVFAAASAPDPQQQARQRSAEQLMPTLRAPQRVDLSIAAAEADLDTLRRRGAALKTFYATLSAGQQAIFDQETNPTERD